MARQIVKQPDGKFSCWSTIIDNFVCKDLTKEEYIEKRAQDAYQDKKNEMKHAFEEIEMGKGGIYTEDYEECLERIEELKEST